MYMASLLCVHTIVFCVETTRVQWCKLCCPILVHFLKSPNLELGVYKSGNHVVNSSLQYSLLVVNGYFWSCVRKCSCHDRDSPSMLDPPPMIEFLELHACSVRIKGRHALK